MFFCEGTGRVEENFFLNKGENSPALSSKRKRRP